MLKLTMALAMIALTSVALSAAPVQCGGVSTMSTLQGYTDGCYDQDKLYTDFSYSGGGSVGANSVFVVIGTSFPSPGVDQHTVTLTTPGGWTTSFDFGYTISIYNPPNLQLQISAAALDITAPDVGGITNTSSAEKTLLSNTGVLYNLLATQQSGDTVAGLNSQSLQITGAVAVASGASVSSVTDTYFESTVPEPATYALMGAGLFLVGLFRRRS